MNVAMTYLQDQLVLQKGPPSPGQRSSIDAHPSQGRAMLEKAGVTDRLWLQVVQAHHANLPACESMATYPMGPKVTRILQTVDRYTASLSPRKSRSGRTARDSVRSVVVSASDAKHDEVGTALVRLLGLSPPGTFVGLANGETAVVVRKGLRPADSWVATVLNRDGQLIAEPRLRDTSREGMGIQSTLVATSVKVNLNLELMLRMIPKGPALTQS